MKKTFILLTITALTCLMLGLLQPNVYGQTIKTVGSSVPNYTTLKIAFDSINAGKIKGTIILQIVDNTTETAVASLKASGTGSSNYTSVTIYPTGTSSISGSSSKGCRKIVLFRLKLPFSTVVDEYEKARKSDLIKVESTAKMLKTMFGGK